MAPLSLLVPEKADPERDAVAAAWEGAGGTVVRLGRFWDPPPIDRASARVYGNDTFCLVLAEKLSLRLVSPSDRLLASVPDELLHRRVKVVALGTLGATDFPAFVKSVVPKQFKSAVYDSAEALRAETHGLAPDTEVIVSEIVRFVAEARGFALDGAVKACAIYEGFGSRDDAARAATRVLATVELPRTCVVDVGLLEDGRWALVECNASWGAGLNGCEAADVIACIAAASGVVP
jgi:hypothetical protein